MRPKEPHLIGALLALLVFSSASQAQESADPTANVPVPAAAAFEGCYALRLGRWWPWGMGEDTRFATPPSEILLTPSKGTEGFEKYGFVIREIPSAISHRSAFWNSYKDQHLILTWTNGFSGVTLNLVRRGPLLRGWAHAHFDSPRLPHIARVEAKPISCGSVQQ